MSTGAKTTTATTRIREFLLWHLGLVPLCATPGGWQLPSMQLRESRQPADPLDALLARSDAAAHEYLADRLLGVAVCDPASAPPPTQVSRGMEEATVKAKPMVRWPSFQDRRRCNHLSRRVRRDCRGPWRHQRRWFTPGDCRTSRFGQGVGRPRGHNEAFIAAAPIERFEDLSVGVTHPRRAFLRPGGLVESVAWKVLPPGRVSGSWESYKSEIAAYELDKLLNLGMVPVAVEKQWKHEIGAAILWLTPVRSWKRSATRKNPTSGTDKW